MKFSISNIGWSNENDNNVYELMKNNGFSGLEIAPTRIFPEGPYQDLNAAKEWSRSIQSKYGFIIPSMQSIWYGRTEKVFGTKEEKSTLLNYTKKAIDFAEVIGCSNLVFGCPRNRSIQDGFNAEEAIPFFRQISDYAFEHNCVIAMEANPPIYNTNFLNTTKQALEFIKIVNSDGFLLNLDVGTMIENEEKVSVLDGNEKYIHHVHISEPRLKPIEKRKLHNQLADLLKEIGYDGYVSIEVGNQDNIEAISSMMEYVKNVFQ